jgi:hypothetical protein
MGKMFVTVQVPTELTSIFIAECEDGCVAYVVSEQLHYALYKTNVSLPNINQYQPAQGAPIAGYINSLAIWKRLSVAG